jgi:cytochrome c oxidase subunit 2
VNQTTRITLVSNDTIHGFYVPVFNGSRYAQPGVTNVFDLTPTHTGVFRAQCTQLCGLYHSLMFFHVVVLPQDQYQAWVRQSQILGGKLTGGTDTGLGASPSIPAYPGGVGTTTSTTKAAA